MRVFSKTLLLPVVIASCEPPPPLPRLGNIIGKNDIIQVTEAWESGQIEKKIFSMSLRATALVTTISSGKTSACLGSLITGENSTKNPRIITNRHCFALDRKNLLAGACQKTRVFFNFSLTGKPLLERKCLNNSMHTDIGADLAMFTLHEKLPKEYRPFVLWQGEVPAGRRAFLVHYPNVIHDFSSPSQSVALLPSLNRYFSIAAVSAKNCTIVGRAKEDLWHMIPFGMVHSCDMTKGSSGGALVDLKTGKLLGVSWGGLRLKVAKTVRKINFAISPDFLQKFINTGSALK